MADDDPKPVSEATIPEGGEQTDAEVTADNLTEWLDTHPESGLGGVSVVGGAVTLAWKGDPPADVLQLLATEPVTTPVTVAPAAYSAAELDAQAIQVADANPDTVASVGPRDDFSGLQILLQPRRTTDLQPQATRQISATVPVTIAGYADPVPTNRNNDTRPFYGANLIKNGSYVCSGGVAVTVGATTGLSTAWHCGTGTWQTYGNSNTIGTIGARAKGLDTQVINGSTTGRVFQGPWNAFSSAPVKDSIRPGNNTAICVSGGLSGESCSKVTVRGVNQYANIAGVGRVGPGFWVLSTGVSGGSQVGIADQGDSGAPAYTYATNGSMRIKGFIVGGDQTMKTTKCKGNPDFVPSGHGCYARIFVVNSVDALSALGARIKTN
ncbi:S1 family peptidase [Actinoplanes sp. KI2]|uniref:S1 family peptidase n=1 Tax=Actinoplanes sp. KI2 TaxID=2983315 RepID=UPI0021D5BD37|nr:S1 family peptidase [Actinoplanes sp. KI2]MCU7724906.1 S1 family peptidase [Actinoplanes sp. KI2]